jgi:hypothetical protein
MFGFGKKKFEASPEAELEKKRNASLKVIENNLKISSISSKLHNPDLSDRLIDRIKNYSTDNAGSALRILELPINPENIQQIQLISKKLQ